MLYGRLDVDDSKRGRTEKNRSFQDVVLQKNTEITLGGYGNNKEVLERMREKPYGVVSIKGEMYRLDMY